VSDGTQRAKLVTGPGDERARFLVEAGYMALCLGDPERARTIFLGVRAVLPEHHAGALGEAEALLDLDRPQEALRAAREAVRGDGHARATLAWATLVQAKAALRIDDRSQARECCARAVEMDPRGSAAELARQWVATMDDLAGTGAAIAGARRPGGVR
jgi:tetratricopeptide (TPR) repeat protein